MDLSEEQLQILQLLATKGNETAKASLTYIYKQKTKEPPAARIVVKDYNDHSGGLAALQSSNHHYLDLMASAPPPYTPPPLDRSQCLPANVEKVMSADMGAISMTVQAELARYATELQSISLKISGRSRVLEILRALYGIILIRVCLNRSSGAGVS